jgi:hypothetical protein
MLYRNADPGGEWQITTEREAIEKLAPPPLGPHSSVDLAGRFWAGWQPFDHEVDRSEAEKLDRKRDCFSYVSILVDSLLGACRHRCQSRPFTLENQTYKVCLDCEKKFAYSLEKMALC